MKFTAEELDLIVNALRYTIENGYTFQDDDDIKNEYEQMHKLLDKVYEYCICWLVVGLLGESDEQIRSDDSIPW